MRGKCKEIFGGGRLDKFFEGAADHHHLFIYNLQYQVINLDQ